MELIIDSLASLKIPLENKVLEMEYIAVDMLKGVERIKRKWDLPVPKDAKSVIAYYTDLILRRLRIGGAFAKFYPIVKKYVQSKLFDVEVDINDPRTLYNLSNPKVQEELIRLFVDAFKEMTSTEREPKRTDVIKLLGTPPFVWSKQVYPADKCIFNYVPCDNNFEIDFAKFLDRAEDVEAFSKIVPKIGFFVEYRDSNGNLRLYYPDFIVKMKTGEKIIVETKGRVDVDVEHKDARIKIWCEDASNLTGEKWKFVRVDQKLFERYKFKNMIKIIDLLHSKTPQFIKKIQNGTN